MTYRTEAVDSTPHWPLNKIIEVANQLTETGACGASTGEQIAAAFVLNRMEFLPEMYSDVTEAWARLDDWQVYVYQIKRDYCHLFSTEKVVEHNNRAKVEENWYA